MPRKPTQKQLILEMLTRAGHVGVKTNEFLGRFGVGSRYSARIHELRKEGWIIESTPIRTGQALFVLKGRGWPRRSAAPTKATRAMLEYRVNYLEDLVAHLRS